MRLSFCQELAQLSENGDHDRRRDRGAEEIRSFDSSSSDSFRDGWKWTTFADRDGVGKLYDSGMEEGYRGGCEYWCRKEWSEDCAEIGLMVGRISPWLG